MKLFKNKVNRASSSNYLKTQTNSNKLVNFINQNKIPLIVILLLLVGAFSVQYFNKTSYALDNPVTGTSDTCSWTIDTNGKLTISPQTGDDSCTLGKASNNTMPWYSNRTDITSVEVGEGVIANVDSRSLFSDLENAESINVDNLDTSNVTVMYNMFYDCSSLVSIDVSSFNTSNVTTMSGMFENCSSLESVDVSGFNTSNVIAMASMFLNCSSLKDLDLSSFNTSNLKNMALMFRNCASLTNLDLSNFNTSNVTTMRDAFSLCSALTSLDLSNFNTGNVTDMSSMFWRCSALTSLDISNFNTSNVTDMRAMFSQCSALTSLDISSFNTSNVTNMSRMFDECSSLTSLDLSNFNTSNVTDMSRMFYICHNLKNLNLSSFDMTKVPYSNYTSYMLSNVGQQQKEGCRITLNKTFDKNYSSAYRFPYSYYAKETNGTLSSNLYTLAQMQVEVTSSNTPTTWVPAYSVTYDGNGGTINSNNTLVKTYRIGSKINTKNVTPVKISYDFIKWNNSSNGTGSLTVNKNGESANAYGTKYDSTGLTNGNITLYAQYNLPVSDVEFIKKDNVTGDPVSGASFSLTGTSDAGESVSKTATSTSTGKVTFTDVPFGTYTVHETTVPSGYSSNNLRDFTVKVQR